MIRKSCSKISTKFLKSNNPGKSSTNTAWLDANHLYGHSMMKLFSIEILDWVNLKNFDSGNNPNDGPVGNFLEVDLDYPD